MRINTFYAAVFVLFFFIAGGFYLAFSDNSSQNENGAVGKVVFPPLSQTSSEGNTQINSRPSVSSRISGDDDDEEEEDEDDSPRRPSLPASSPSLQPKISNPITTPSSPSNSSLSCGSRGACSPAEVASHNTVGDCFVSLGSPINKVYNVTAYVGNPELHPGGNVIIPYCGKDIYNYFIGNAGGHKHSSKALNTILEAYYIGPLKI